MRTSALAGLLLVGSVVGCSSASTTADPAGPAVSTVVAERRDITPIVTVDGAIGHLDQAVLSVSGRGRVQRAKNYRKGSLRNLPIGTTVGTVAGQAVQLPTSAIDGKWLVADDAEVGRGYPVFSYRPSALAVIANIPSPGALAALTSLPKARAQILGGPAPFDCSLLNVAGVASSPSPAEADASESDVPLACALPVDVPAVSGAPAVLALRTSTRRAVLAVPVTAVAGRVDRGAVTLVESHDVKEVSVRLGVTDGSYVEVLDGLQPGATIAADAPNLRLVSP